MEAVCMPRFMFNETINMSARYGYHVLNVTTCDSSGHFDHWGNLSEKGKHVYWSEIDEVLENLTENKSNCCQ